MEDDYNSAKHNDESDEMVDPTMFLERTADEGEDALMVNLGYTPAFNFNYVWIFLLIRLPPIYF